MDTPAPDRTPILRSLLLVPSMAIIGALSAVYAVSFSVIIFNGPLVGLLERGIGLTLIGSIIMGVAGALFLRNREALIQPQDVTAVVLALGAANIAGRMQGASADSLFASVAMLLVVTAIVTGALSYLFGRLRLGHLARFLPYPVLGGFLAATGYLLLRSAVNMALGTTVTADNAAMLLAPDVLGRWLPWVLVGAALFAATELHPRRYTFPLGIAVIATGFFLWLAVTGTSLSEASARGLMLGPFDTGEFAPVTPGMAAQADWWLVLSQAPLIVTVAGLTVVAGLLKASAVELALDEEFDLNEEMKSLGVVNIAAAISATPVGFHSLGRTLLAANLGLHGILPGLSVALGCAVVVLFGSSLLSVLPLGLFIAIVASLGWGMVWTWVWAASRRIPLREYLIIPAILAAAVGAGFLQAIALGLVLSSVLFIVSYSKVGIVHAATTGAARRSNVERGADDLAFLARRGGRLLVLELDGYIFFGTAYGMLQSTVARLKSSQPRVTTLLVDFRRVVGIDSSAGLTFAKLHRTCAREGVSLVFSGLGEGLAREILPVVRESGADAPLGVFPTLDAALEALENEVLAGGGAQAGSGGGVLERIAREHPGFDVAQLARRERLKPGEVLFEAGAPPDSIVIVRSGNLVAEVETQGTTHRVAKYEPGAVVGEIGHYADIPRTARVRAETPAEVLVFDNAAIAALERDRPGIAIALHRAVASVMAGRLTRMTRLLHEADL